MRLHRIALATRAATAAMAFDGQGGLYGHGRWHVRGKPMVYTADHPALAMAETLVHLQRSYAIEPFHHWEIEVPDSLIEAEPPLPAGWQGNVAFTQAWGDAWLTAQTSVAQLVPSALVPQASNCLLNPAHPQFDLRWVVAGPTPFHFDPRLTRP
jgi:RES domain-containing protein